MILFKINCLTFSYIFLANRIITSSQRPLILKYATLSKGVVCKLTMISFPFLPTSRGTSAAGVTVKELPNAKQRSDLAASSNERLISYSGRFYPKLMIES